MFHADTTAWHTQEYVPLIRKAGSGLAGRGATSFLKRQKEQQRTARALAKRAAKQARRDNRETEPTTEMAPDEVGDVESSGLPPAPDDARTD